jgi:NAD+ synthase
MKTNESNILRIAAIQANPKVGDVSGNMDMLRSLRQKASKKGAHLAVFSELFISGYPPEDLVLKGSFQHACRKALEDFIPETKDGGADIVVGLPWEQGGHVYNMVALIGQGKLLGIRAKVDLPNYGVFDEKRVFHKGAMPEPLDWRGIKLGLPICEDLWNKTIAAHLAEKGADILVTPNGSPFWQGKCAERLKVMRQRVEEVKKPIIYVNQIGGQDELVFDGGSFGLNSDGSLAFAAPQFEEAILMSEWQKDVSGDWSCKSGEHHSLPDNESATWQACVLGLRDYVNKNGFHGVVLGLSGGIDSAVVAAMAVDALGNKRVHCVMLPYKYTSATSLKDASECAKALGVQLDTIPIDEPVNSLNKALASTFEGKAADITEENLQSRMRGTILMALSNKFGSMVVTTGNKSEMSVGYATLYGDMNGGFNPIKDLYKTEVFRLAKWRNGNRPEGMLGPKRNVIPDNITIKPPSAELREDQTDQDSLPPYDSLDAILEALVEKEMPVRKIVEAGYDEETVRRVEHLLYIAEYKRRQAAPGVKITKKQFGRDRRYPITNGWRDGV